MPNLVSDLHVQARVKATEAIASALTREKQGRKASCPVSQLCPPRYERHTFKIDWAVGVRLSTVAGKLNIPFILPDYFKSMTSGKVCTGDLILKSSGWWLHISVDLPAPKVRENKQSVGIDLGVNRPAVTSTKQFLGKRHWKDIEAKIFNQRRQLQSKGTKSSKRKLRKVRGRQARFRRDCDHVLSRQIVNSVKPGGTIVLENLVNIRSRMRGRKRQRRRLHSWSFAQLKEFVTYKAENIGTRVVMIDPRHTSQTCNRCGFQHRSNRQSQSLFKCRQCGHTCNADLNAARNIRSKHLGTFGMPLRVRLSPTSPTSRKAQCGGLYDLLQSTLLLGQ
jgi:putative transposase